MNILVCIKQVPDMEAGFTSNAAGTWFDEAGLAFRMNDYDEYAVEEAVRLRESFDGVAGVTALSIGPDRVAEVLRKAMAMGCDHAVHIRDESAAERDPWQIASMIAGYARPKAFDLILTGMQSIDRGSAQVGLLTAELLGIVGVSTVVGFSLDGRQVTVERELERGARGAVSFDLPALVTCQLGLNTPRYPTLPGILKAKRKEITVLMPLDVGLVQPLATAGGFTPRDRSASGMVLEGRIDDLAMRVAAILREKVPVLRTGGAR